MEFVYVVPRNDLFRDCYPQGLVRFGERLALAEFEETVRERGYFVERERAERDPALKQIIPYSVACQGGHVLLMRRLAGSGERRLRDKLSIGVGGHINPEDLEHAQSASPASPPCTGRRDPIAAGTARELAEELDIRGESSLRPVGILNDDSNPVGAVHLGFVQVLSIHGAVSIRERDVLEGRLVPPQELARLRADGANFESWSSLLVEHLDELFPRVSASTTAPPALPTLS